MDYGIWAISLEPLEWLWFALAGISSGIINTLAGSGSLITLPIFMFICGLPADIANGTNRIGVLFQSSAGVYGFYKEGQTDYSKSNWIVLATVLGAIMGSRIAVNLDEKMLNYTIGGLMVFMLMVLLVKPKRWLTESKAEAGQNRKPLVLALYFLIGVYGGFIQAGVGIFMLAALVLASRYSLSSANGVKLLMVLLYGLPTLFIFFYYGKVHVGFGLMMALFQTFGVFLALRFIRKVPNANVWIHRLLILIVVVSALKLFGILDYLISVF